MKCEIVAPLPASPTPSFPPHPFQEQRQSPANGPAVAATFNLTATTTKRWGEELNALIGAHFKEFIRQAALRA